MTFKCYSLINNMTSEGVSVVVAVLFEDTDTTTWSETLTHNMAHTLLTLAPETLRSYYKAPGKVEELAQTLSHLTDKRKILHAPCWSQMSSRTGHCNLVALPMIFLAWNAPGLYPPFFAASTHLARYAQLRH